MPHACINLWDIFTNIYYKRETCTAKKKRECCNKVKHVQTIKINKAYFAFHANKTTTIMNSQLFI